MGTNPLFYAVAKGFFRVLFRVYNGLEVSGTENIPEGMPVIVASNHASNVDPPLVGCVYPGRLRYLAKESLFANPILGFLIRTLGAVPVKREDSQRAGAVMKLMLTLLFKGESILIFPEGSRSRDGRIKPLEAGVAFLSVKLGVPVLPVYIRGSHNVCPPGKRIPRPVKLKVTFSSPISPDVGISSDKQRREHLMSEIERRFKEMEEASGHDRSR